MKTFSDFIPGWKAFVEKFNAHTAKVENVLEAREANEDLQAKVTQLEADLGTAKQSIASQKAELEQANNELAARDAFIAKLEDQLKLANDENEKLVSDPDAVASRKAAAIVASTGTESIEAVVDGEVEKKTSTELWAEYNRLKATDPSAASKFYQEHREVLFLSN